MFWPKKIGGCRAWVRSPVGPEVGVFEVDFHRGPWVTRKGSEDQVLPVEAMASYSRPKAWRREGSLSGRCIGGGVAGDQFDPGWRFARRWT